MFELDLNLENKSLQTGWGPLVSTSVQTALRRYSDCGRRGLPSPAILPTTLILVLRPCGRVLCSHFTSSQPSSLLPSLTLALYSPCFLPLGSPLSTTNCHSLSLSEPEGSSPTSPSMSSTLLKPKPTATSLAQASSSVAVCDCKVHHRHPPWVPLQSCHHAVELHLALWSSMAWSSSPETPCPRSPQAFPFLRPASPLTTFSDAVSVRLTPRSWSPISPVSRRAVRGVGNPLFRSCGLKAPSGVGPMLPRWTDCPVNQAHCNSSLF
jgi:hypothetical protein